MYKSWGRGGGDACPPAPCRGLTGHPAPALAAATSGCAAATGVVCDRPVVRGFPGLQ
jgi:hypothetical protein